MLKNFKIKLLILSMTAIVIVILKYYSPKIVNDYKVEKYYNSYNIKEYYAVLKISNLDINNVIYKIGSKENMVDKNIFLAYEDKNIIVLAAHSGNSPISYFKNLSNLNKGDNIQLLMDNKIRTYKLFFKKEVKKNLRLKINKYNYPILVLITCSKEDKTKQEIYYTRLIKTQISSKI